MNFYPLKMFYTFLFLSSAERGIIKDFLIKNKLYFIFCKAGLLKSINIPSKFLDNSGFFLIIFSNEFSENNQKFVENQLSGYLNFFVFKNYITNSIIFDVKKAISFFLSYHLSIFYKLSLFKNFILIKR